MWRYEVLKEVYLDNSASTSVCPEALEKAVYMMKAAYGNPSSLHSKGFEAEREVTTARRNVASALGADENEIYFCSGGTEANNLAVFGAARANARAGKRIVTTAIEHSSVLASMKELENQGFEVEYISPDTDGNIPAERIINAITNETALVSVMLVNNELGTVLPVQQVGRAIEKGRLRAILHCDAVQAFGKMPVNVKRLGAKLVSVSGHKIHGPKGVGALYVSKGTRIIPLMYGGEQQKRLRPGTEASPLIAAMGEAVRLLDIEGNAKHASELNRYCRERLSDLEGVIINSPENALPYIINLSVPGIRSETMMHFLEQRDIYVSSGSACSKGKKSHVLEALGMSAGLIDSAIRVSFSKYNTKQDIDIFIDALSDGMKSIARSR